MLSSDKSNQSQEKKKKLRPGEKWGGGKNLVNEKPGIKRKEKIRTKLFFLHFICRYLSTPVVFPCRVFRGEKEGGGQEREGNRKRRLRMRHRQLVHNNQVLINDHRSAKLNKRRQTVITDLQRRLYHYSSFVYRKTLPPTFTEKTKKNKKKNFHFS